MLPLSNDNPFFTRIGSAFHAAAEAVGYHVLTVVPQGNADNERLLIEDLVGQMVEAIVFTAQSSCSTDVIRWVLSQKIPVIMIERPRDISDIDVVLLDSFEGVRLAVDKMLWNGEYYVQVVEDVNENKYQYGTGCLSDQLLGQQLSHVAGLGYILPEEHVKKSVQSIFKYNFFNDLSNHYSVQRTYALNDERGLVLCSWPMGGRPRLPFVYSDEVWTGIEYQVAAHLIYEGFIDEGLTIVKAVRERHDGIRRNPWNEVECGNHYARSMASWSLLPALSGYKFDLVNNIIEFNPVINQESFSCFFSCGKAWGVFSQILNTDNGEYDYDIKTLYGSLNGIMIKANGKCIN